MTPGPLFSFSPGIDVKIASFLGPKAPVMMPHRGPNSLRLEALT